MKKTTRFVGLDVHAESIAVAVAESGRNGEVRSLGLIPNRLESIRKLVQNLAVYLSARRRCAERLTAGSGAIPSFGAIRSRFFVAVTLSANEEA
jgi:hypothetical protein